MLAHVSRQRGGFTLVELVGVITVLTALSLTAIPALRSIGWAGASADRRTAETLCVLARERAWATGLPHALRIDADGGAAEVVVLPAFNVDPIAIPGPTGGAADPRRLADDAVTAVTGVQPAKDGASYLWFSAAGEPLQDRPSDEIGAPIVNPIEVRFKSGEVLAVAPRSGVIEW